MRAVVICDGTITDYGHIKNQTKEDDFIIRADSGYDYVVKMGIKTDLVVRDFDSIKQTPKNTTSIQYHG